MLFQLFITESFIFVIIRVSCLISNQIKSYYLHQAKKGGDPLYFYCDEYHLFVTTLFSRFLAEARKYNISMNFAGHSLAQVDKKLASMILANCYVKVVLSCGAQDAELLAKEININPEDIRNLKEKEHEAYVGIGKKPHKVLTYPGLDVPPYKPKPAIKPTKIDFLSNGWMTI